MSLRQHPGPSKASHSRVFGVKRVAPEKPGSVLILVQGFWWTQAVALGVGCYTPWMLVGPEREKGPPRGPGVGTCFLRGFGA